MMESNKTETSDIKVNSENNPKNENNIEVRHHLDTQGLICPEPVMMLHRTIRKADAGDYIEVLATDPATTRDIPNFCRHLGHTLVDNSESLNPEGDSDNHTNTLYRYIIQKKSS